MTTRLKIEHKGKEYILEYTRETVKKMEDRGFVVSRILDAPMNVLPDLFYGAFLANHKYIDRKVTDAIFNEMEDPKELVELLAEMYNEPLKALMAGPEEGNGIKWERV